MASARPYPPSAQRIAVARASGHVPRPALVALGSVWLTTMFVLWAYGAHLLHELATLFRSTVELCGRGDSALARAAVWSWVISASQSFALIALAAFVSIALSLAFAQGASHAGRRALRVRFAKLEVSRTAGALLSLSLLLTTAIALAELPLLEISDLAAFALRWASYAALFTLFCTFIDVAFARARFFRSLWMTRAELRDEQRSAFGAPELREARRRSQNTAGEARA